MLNKTLIVAGLLLTLTGCSDGYDQAAQQKAQQAQQKQYASMADCQKEFKTPGDCYQGRSGGFYSPIFYPWGAIMRNGTAYYDQPVPTSGSRWVNNPSASSVNFGRSSTYVSTTAAASRASYSGSSMGTSTAARGGFGSTAGGFGASSGG